MMISPAYENEETCQLVAALVLIKAVSALEQKPNIVFVFLTTTPPCHRSLRRMAEVSQSDSRHRPTCIRRHAVCQQLLYEFDLRAQPGRHSDRQA